MEKNLTALVSCFARAYHDKNYTYKIFRDEIASKILSEEEYDNIAKNMAQGIRFFNPNFNQSTEEALRFIVDHQLSPSVLGRSAFCEESLLNAVNQGCFQYVILASGYDTFAYRNSIEKLKIFEVDKKEMIEDKVKRLKRSHIDSTKACFIPCDFSKENWIQKILLHKDYDCQQRTFCSLLGISYYLSKNDFSRMIQLLSKTLIRGSQIVFDYPTVDESEETIRNEALAQAANEKMKAKYHQQEMKKILQENHFQIEKYLDDEKMNQQYFTNYNDFNPKNKIFAPKGIHYCLARKK